MRNFAYIADKKFNKPLVDRGTKATNGRTTYNSDPGRLARHALLIGFSSSHIIDVAARTVMPNEFDRVSLEIPRLSIDDQYVPDNERCNRPYEESYSRNRGFITTENIVATFAEKSGAYASPFAVTRDIALRFWGDILPTSAELKQQRKNASHGSYVQETGSPGQGQAIMCRPASSNYESRACSPSLASQTRPRTFGGEHAWNEEDFSGCFIHTGSVPIYRSVEPMDRQEFSTNMGMLVPTNRDVATVSPLDYTSIETRRQALRISEASSVGTELCEEAYEADMPADRMVGSPLDHDNDAAVTPHVRNPWEQLRHASANLDDEAHLACEHGLAREQTPKRRERVFGIRRGSTHAKERRQRKTRARAHRKDDQLGQADDFKSEMRETEERILSATEVVEEVYDDSLESSSDHETRKNRGEQEPSSVPNSNRHHTVFPGGQSKRAGTVFEGWQVAHAGTTPPEEFILLPSAAGVVEEGQFALQPGSEHDADFEPQQLSPSGVSAALRFKHKTVFPGPSNEKLSGLTSEQRQSVDDHHVHEHRRRKRQDGDSEAVVGRLPSIQPAQIAGWDTFSAEVEAISSIWNELNHGRIYITSTVDVPELACQLYGRQKRLWSWSQQDYERFQSQMDGVLSQDFGLQLVSSDRHPQGRHYYSASPREFWMTYFRKDIPLYWLAILVPRRTMGVSWKKVRRTNMIDSQ